MQPSSISTQRLDHMAEGVAVVQHGAKPSFPFVGRHDAEVGSLVIVLAVDRAKLDLLARAEEADFAGVAAIGGGEDAANRS